MFARLLHDFGVMRVAEMAGEGARFHHFCHFEEYLLASML